MMIVPSTTTSPSTPRAERRPRPAVARRPAGVGRSGQDIRAAVTGGAPAGSAASRRGASSGGQLMGVAAPGQEPAAAEKVIHELELKLQAAEELAGLGVWTSTLDTDRTPVLSPTARRILGFRADAPVSELEVLERIHPDDRSAALRLDRLTRDGDWHGEFRIRDPRGEVRWVATQVRLLRGEDGAPQRLLGAVMDVTRYRRAQEGLKAAAARQSRLAEVARLGIDSARPARLARAAIRVACRALGMELAILGRIEDDHLVTVASHGFPRGAPRRTPLAELPLAGRALPVRGPVVVRDHRRSDVGLSPVCAHLGVRSSIAVAIHGPTRPYGVLQLHALSPRRHSAADVAWLRSIADVLSVAFERARVDDALHATVRELTRIDGQRRALLAHLVGSQEVERDRIATDLHDDVVQLLGAVNLRLAILRGDPSGPLRERNVEAIQELIAQATARLRELFVELRPPALDRYGLIAALRAELEQLRDRSGLRPQLRSTIEREPEPSARTVIFRIAQEALQNIRRHAGATTIEVDVANAAGGTRVRIRDDGLGLPRGFVAGAQPGRMGLTVMEERARLAGGWWRIATARGGGTAVEFWVPGLAGRPGFPALAEEIGDQRPPSG